MIYRVSAHFKELFKMKILVIVDMQNDFINGALGTPEAQAAVGDVAKKISGFDGDLICITKDTHRSADYLKTQEGQLLPVEHCIEGTGGSTISLPRPLVMRLSTRGKAYPYSRRIRLAL